MTLKLTMILLFVSFFILSVVLIVVPIATVGKETGLRLVYLRLLSRIFECIKEIEEKRRRSDHDKCEESEDDQEYWPENNRQDDKAEIIDREATERINSKLNKFDNVNTQNLTRTIVDDSFDFINAAMESIIEDEVTSRFRAQDLRYWNLLGNDNFSIFEVMQEFSWQITLFFLLGLLFRYFVLFPVRFALFLVGGIQLLISTYLIGLLSNGRLKSTLNYYAVMVSFRIICRSISTIVNFHNTENMAKNGGICVANHTTPIDAMILNCGNCYAFIGQKQGGLLGVIQRALHRSANHIWFERAAANDRKQVMQRMRDHIKDEKNLPILIFPEGTCINNSAVMMFKKGSFEIGCPIYPVAIKYDPRFGDAFWNSSADGFATYMFKMMTSWAIVVDITYLPMMQAKEDENAIQFAARVKRKIARTGGFIELEWDGGLKRSKVPEKIIDKQKVTYSKRLLKVGSDRNTHA